jgi:hypothetical protein
VLITMERLAGDVPDSPSPGSRTGLHVERLRGRRAAVASAVGWAMFTLAVALPIYRLVTWAIEARRTDQTATVAGDLGFHVCRRCGLPGWRPCRVWRSDCCSSLGLNRRRRSGALLARLATLGYTVPGPVVAIGVLVTLAATRPHRMAS